MIIPTSIEEINRMIIDGVEENTNLEYKAADALQNTDGKKKEIAKDVSAMANSAGGIIIYGVKEFDEEIKKHLPEKITPILRTQFSKEQLDQIINSNISPKIEGVKIQPIPLLNENEVVYIVEIPQSNTAHQNTKDQRYYRRHNFEVLPMLDYEIRDIMNRVKHPVVEMNFEITKFTFEDRPNPMFSQTSEFSLNNTKPSLQKKYKTTLTLKIFPKNTGNIFALYINYFINIPQDIADVDDVKYLNKPETGIIEFYGENTFRDVIDYQHNPFGGITKYGPSRFDPVLPGLRGRPKELKLVESPNLDNREITWTVYADNASPMTGSIRLNEISIIEKHIENEDE